MFLPCYTHVKAKLPLYLMKQNFINCIQNSIQNPSIKVTSIYRGNYWI